MPQDFLGLSRLNLPYTPTQPTPAQIQAQQERDKRIKWTQEAEHVNSPLWKRALNNIGDAAAGFVEGTFGASDQLFSPMSEERKREIRIRGGDLQPREMGQAFGEAGIGPGEVIGGGKALLGGAGAALKAVNLVPPQMIEALVKAAKSRILGRGGLRADDIPIVEKAMDRDPLAAANVRDVSYIDEAKDFPAYGINEGTGAFYDNQQTYYVTPQQAEGVRNDKAWRSHLDDVVSGRAPSQSFPQIKVRSDIRENPRFNASHRGTPERIIGHEYRHAGQDARDQLSPSMEKTVVPGRGTYDLWPHELDAHITERRIQAEKFGTPFDYADELAKVLTAHAKVDPKKIPEIMETLKSPLIQNALRSEGRGKQLRHVPGEGFKIDMGGFPSLGKPPVVRSDFSMPEQMPFGAKPERPGKIVKDVEQAPHEFNRNATPEEIKPQPPVAEANTPEHAIERAPFDRKVENLPLPADSKMEIQLLDDTDSPYGINASGTNVGGGSLEEVNRTRDMKAKGEKFMTRFKGTTAPSTVDRKGKLRKGEEYGVMTPTGFKVLDRGE